MWRSLSPIDGGGPFLSEAYVRSAWPIAENAWTPRCKSRTSTVGTSGNTVSPPPPRSFLTSAASGQTRSRSSPT